MPRYRLTIAYDGTEFCGWQKQEPPAAMEVASSKVLSPVTGLPAEGPERVALRTVQAVVEQAVRETVREPVELRGASRTDAGVHARGQVAAFTCGGDAPEAGEEVEDAAPRGRTGWPLSRGTDKLGLAINSRLPEDVAVVGAEACAPGFDPIGDCTSKGYSYALHVSPHRALFDRHFVHHVWVPLDVEAMRRAAERLVGERDFAAFAAAGHGRQSTVRTVFECRVEEEPGHGAEWARRVRIEVSGNGFLYNMVRIIAGTLLEVGRGKMTPEDVSAALESRDRRRAGPTLPATGLCLEWVRYA